MKFRGIPLSTDFRKGDGIALENLPAVPGIYAEVYWPKRGLRIGETGRSIRAKVRHDVRWFRSMHNGTAPEHQLRRRLPIALAAKATGEVGFEFYVISADQRLADKALRQECERFLFAWAQKAEGFVDWNRQRSWH